MRRNRLIRSCSALWNVELVAETTDRDDAHGIRGINLHLGPQTFDVDIECLRIAHIVTPPHSIDERIASQNAASIGEQE